MKNWKVGDLFFSKLYDEEWKDYYILFLVDEETEEAFHVSPLFSSNGLVPLYWANGTWEKKSVQPRGLYFLT